MKPSVAIGLVSFPLWGVVSGRPADSDSASDGKIHVVTVGKAQDQFVPNSLTANAGDIIEFQFFPPNHSVIRAEYQHPCIPYEYTGENKTGFFSGFFPLTKILSDPPSWNLTINDTEPIFLYCGAKGSCINHQMVAVINPNSSVSLGNQKLNAAESTYELVPGEPFPAEDGGGSGDPNDVPSASKAPTAPSAASAAGASSTSAAKTASHGSHLSSGAIAGIVIGILFVVGLIGALLFLLGRHKTLLQFTRDARHSRSYTDSPGPKNPMMEKDMGSPVFPLPPKGSFRSAGPLPQKDPIPTSGHPAYANSDYIYQESPYGVPPYSEQARSPTLSPDTQIHVAELAALADSNRGTMHTVRRDSHRRGTMGSRTGSERDMERRPSEQQQRQMQQQGQQPEEFYQQQRAQQRRREKQRQRESSSWLSSPVRDREGRKSLGLWGRSRSNNTMNSQISSDSGSPDSPTLGSPPRIARK